MKGYEYAIATARGDINSDDGQELFFSRINTLGAAGYRVISASLVIVPEHTSFEDDSIFRKHERYFAILEREKRGE